MGAGGSGLVHLVVLLALLWSPLAGHRAGLGGANPFGSAITVGLTPLPQAAPTAAIPPRPKPPSTIPGYLPVAASPPAASEDQASGSAAATGSGLDDEGLYRVPFRDAVRQAFASLRGGLGCAHVDLAKLPDSVRALCEAASGRERPTETAQTAPAEERPADVDGKWTVQMSAAAKLDKDCAAAKSAGKVMALGPHLRLPPPTSLCDRDERVPPAAKLRLAGSP